MMTSGQACAVELDEPQVETHNPRPRVFAISSAGDGDKVGQSGPRIGVRKQSLPKDIAAY